MNSTIRVLTIEDYDAIRQISRLTDLTQAGFDNFYLRNCRHKTFGYFFNNNLIEFISIIENQEIPAWTVSKLFSMHESFSQPILSYIISYQERNKRYQFFTVSSNKKSHMIDSRYNCYVEHVIPQGTLTGFENIDHDILEYQKYDQNMFVHLWVLKNEYRTF